MPIPVGFSSGGGGRTITPTPATSWSAAYGGVPAVPSPGASASTAIGANLGNLSNILNLGGGVQRFTDQAAINQVRIGLPNYDALVAESSANILQQLQGDVPNDVVNQIIQRAAERGIITGTTGSQSANAAMLRALGLTSLDMMQRGESNLTGAIGRTPRGPIFNPSGMFISPQEQQEAEMAANIYASAPIPQAAGTRGLGAAKAGLRRGATWAQQGATNAPSWETVRQTPQTSASWADYGPTQAYSNPSLQGPEPAPYDWYASTFGAGARQFTGGGGFSNLDYDPNRYYADPAGGGFIDLDTGDYYD